MIDTALDSCSQFIFLFDSIIFHLSLEMLEFGRGKMRSSIAAPFWQFLSIKNMKKTNRNHFVKVG